jgi:hypothetical protein
MASWYVVAVATFIAFVVPLPLIFLWFAIVALIVRPFGVRLPLGLFSFRERSSAFQSLTFPQYVMVCGVLSFGCGMFILTTASSYIEWKYFHGSSRFLSGDELFKNALTWPILAGVMFGVISFFSGSRTSLK